MAFMADQSVTPSHIRRWTDGKLNDVLAVLYPHMTPQAQPRADLVVCEVAELKEEVRAPCKPDHSPRTSLATEVSGLKAGQQLGSKGATPWEGVSYMYY